VAAGCAASLGGYRLIEPGRQTIAGAYTVEPARPWSAFARGEPTTWTIDGPNLQRLRFIGGIEDGQPLLPNPPLLALLRVPDRRPRFRTALTLPEVAEIVADGLFGSLFAPRNIRPAPFGTAPGFRFEVSYATSDGVSREALVAGAVIDRRLHVVVYEGTALHHFARHRDEAERIIDSIRLTATR
jgi:hypothetical protein